MKLSRCSWGNSKNLLYQKYHDKEWGKLNLDSTYLYEMLVLESFQSGLSWETILNKRGNFRKAFANFDYHKVLAELCLSSGLNRWYFFQVYPKLS